MWWLVLFLAQDPSAQAQRIRAAMGTSLSKQRASVERQKEQAPQVVSRSTTPPPACDPVPAPELDKMIDSASRDQHVDAAVVREVARQESGFHPCAISPKGAEGVMQLMPATQVSLDVRNPFDAQESINAGAKLLKQLLEHYNGDLALALGAYNAGAARVDQTLTVPEIPETKS